MPTQGFQIGNRVSFSYAPAAPKPLQFVDGRSLVGESDPSAFARGAQGMTSALKPLTDSVDNLSKLPLESRKLDIEEKRYALQAVKDQAFIDWTKARTNEKNVHASNEGQLSPGFLAATIDPNDPNSFQNLQDAQMVATVNADEKAKTQNTPENDDGQLPAWDASKPEQTVAAEGADPSLPVIETEAPGAAESEAANQKLAALVRPGVQEAPVSLKTVSGTLPSASSGPLAEPSNDVAPKASAALEAKSAFPELTAAQMREVSAQRAALVASGYRQLKANPDTWQNPKGKIVVDPAVKLQSSASTKKDAKDQDEPTPTGNYIQLEPKEAAELGLPMQAPNPYTGIGSKNVDKMKIQLYKDGEKKVDELDKASKDAGDMTAKIDGIIDLQKNMGGHNVISNMIPPGFDSDVDTMRSYAADLVRDKLKSLGGRILKSEFDLFQKANIGPGVTPEANMHIGNSMKAALTRVSEQHDFFDSYLQRFHNLTGANQAWQEYVTANPLLDPKNPASMNLNDNRVSAHDYFAAKAQNAGQNVPVSADGTDSGKDYFETGEKPTVANKMYLVPVTNSNNEQIMVDKRKITPANTPQDAIALPKGTWYRRPDGQIRQRM